MRLTSIIMSKCSKIYGWGSNLTKLIPNTILHNKNKTSSSTDLYYPEQLNLGEEEEPIEYKYIGSGYQHGLVVYKNKFGISKLISFGLSTRGQLGLGKINSIFDMGKVKDIDIERIEEVSCGRESSFIRMKGGELLAAGNNMYGQLGLGYSKNELKISDKPKLLFEEKFVNIQKNLNVTQIACGLDHTVLLTNENKIYTMGWGADGQLGLGIEPPRDHDIPTEVPFFTQLGQKIQKISSSHDCTIALTENGQVYSWGNSEHGQAMQGKKIDRVLAPTPIKFDKKVIDLAAGGSFSLLLTETGEVFTCGYGVLGLGDGKFEAIIPTKIESLHNVVKVFAYSGVGCAINANGEVFVWGLASPQSNRLGLGPDLNHVTLPKLLPLPYNRFSAKDVALGGHHGLIIGFE